MKNYKIGKWFNLIKENNSNPESLTKFETFIFASGDLFGGGAQILVAFFYLIFLTDVVGLRPSLAGIVILISKIWDGITDPIMGIITDNTRTKYGRRKPYFFAGFFGVIAAMFLLWYPIRSESNLILFSYVLFSYLFYSTISTMVMIPYAAMSSEITMNSKERNTVNGSRLVFSQLSALLAAVLPLEIITLMPSIETGYMAIGLTFGVIYAIPYLFVFFKTHERVAVAAHEKSSFSFHQFLEPFRIRSFRILIGIYLFAFLSMDIVSTVFAFYMNYFLLRPTELNYVLGTMLITQIVFVPIIVFSANKIGKANTLKINIILWLAAIFFLLILSPEGPSWVIYAIAVLMGTGIIGCIVIPWIMYPDVTDVGELAFEKRCSGSFSGIMTFLRKFAAAIGIFIVSQILDFSGYIKPVENIKNGVKIKILQQQPESIIFALKIIVVGFPFLLLVIIFLLARKYPLDIKTIQKLDNYLEWKRGKIVNNPLTENELLELKSKLI
ncbi:MAG: MFS transporter [Ignavibacteriales bacterium]|nr:MFS transporter [Ignavibacteriales bacterium]